MNNTKLVVPSYPPTQLQLLLAMLLPLALIILLFPNSNINNYTIAMYKKHIT